MNMQDKLDLATKIQIRSIQSNQSLLVTLKKMDELMVKSLLVFAGDDFVNIVSIGDVQRAILANAPMATEIGTVLRSGSTLARDTDNLDDIKSLMFEKRMEIMPILDSENQIKELLIWDELFVKEKRIRDVDLNLPVIIMAGGKGTRLKPITNVLPKPLIPLGEKTILERIMDSFCEVGCKHFYLSVNYKADLIRYYFDELKHSEYQIEYFEEPQPLGTAGSLSLLKGKIKSTFFVSNCDILINQDYAEIIDYHNDNENEITLVAAIKDYKIPYGTLETGEQGQLIALKEKPEITYKINSGVYVLEPKLIDEIPKNEFFHITHLIEKVLDRNGKVGVFPISEGSWQDIGQWDEYLAKNTNWR